jgi:hypothetical protein
MQLTAPISRRALIDKGANSDYALSEHNFHIRNVMMADSKFDPEHERILHAALSDNPVAKAGKMFGYPAYKVNDKLAVGLFETGIVIKIGPKRMKELVGKDGIQPFEPMAGRVWKDWVLLTGNFKENKALFDEAVQYVLEETSA